MTITIDSFDGAGARDYTAALDPQNLPKITRKLNKPSTATLALVSGDTTFVVPASGGRLRITRADGVALFAGDLTAAPIYEYLGCGQSGPSFRYQIQAESDEWLLDKKRPPHRADFIMRTAGAVLRQMTVDAGGVFDLTGIDDIETKPTFFATPQLVWSKQAALLALQTRAAYRAHDGKISFHALGTAGQTIDEAAPTTSLDNLKLQSPDLLVNDVTVIGLVEPHAYVKNYFLGDGLTSSFSLAAIPFIKKISTIADEELLNGILNTVLWAITDPSSAISVSGGKLHFNGGTNVDGQTILQFVEQIELAGSVRLQHGELELAAPCSAIIGGIYTGAVVLANCLAGFRVQPSGSVSTITAIVNGAPAGPPVTTVAGHRYALTTRLYCIEAFRSEQTFHSSSHPAGSGRGGAAIPASVRIVLEVHDIDPANPSSVAAPSTVLFDGVIANAPGYCAYASANIANANCTLSFIALSRGVDALVRSTVPGFATTTRLAGNVADGAECSISQKGGLKFFSPYIPVANEAIEVQMRSGTRALARVQNAASIAAGGMRSAVHRVKEPATRDATDCENAALAILDDSTARAWSGTYDSISDLLPGGPATDPWPGESWTITAPSRGANFNAIVHAVEVHVIDPANDRSEYKISFANDAATNNSFQFTVGVLNEDLVPVIPGASFIANLPNAEITGATSTTISVDAGTAPLAGGGIEVRRSDFGWSQAANSNLVGRFTTQAFSITRLARSQTCYLRQFDSSSPPKYSRYSTVLHLDYPF